MHPLIEKVFNHNEHMSSLADKAISTTQLIGPAYKAKLQMLKTPKTFPLDPIKKRGATIGTGFHLLAERALQGINYINEKYAEREVDGITISGTCDLLEKQDDGTYIIYDWKTGVKQSFDKDSIDRTRMQLSIYRWLLQYHYDIRDVGTILYISTSRNNVEDIDVDLMSYNEVEKYIEAKLFQIENQSTADCVSVMGSWICNYCEFECEFRNS